MVCCMDSDSGKVERLNKCDIPIYEPGLEEIVKRNLANGNLKFTDKAEEAIKHSSVVFIAVGTPMSDDGSADLKYVMSVAENIGKYADRDMTVVIKSTVPPGTSGKVYEKIKTLTQFKITMVSNPEFLKEGSAIEDCMSPDRVVIGVNDSDSEKMMRSLYGAFVSKNDRIIVMDVVSAEITKYAANAMLATRISFMNELSGLCEAVGGDISKVRLGIGSDSRIGYSFLYAGAGYGGSCFPKDVRALIKTASENGCETEILNAVENVNSRQKLVLVNKIVKRFGLDLSGLKFALWGLTFKPNTDDMREAPSLVIIRELQARGAEVIAYDPQIKEGYGVEHSENKYDALNGADALILVTEWKEFRSPDFGEISLRLRTKVVFDGRNIWSLLNLSESGIEYTGIGVNSKK